MSDNPTPPGPEVIVGKPAPVTSLAPGDVGYAPPARIAPAAGEVLSREQLGHADAHFDASVNIHGEVRLAMPPPAAQSLTWATDTMRPSKLSKQQAEVQFHRLLANNMTYALDYPHEATGLLATGLKFFRMLAGRNAALKTAQDLGRAVEPDEIDKETAAPPPEYFTLNDLAQQNANMKAIYENALAKGNLKLADSDQATINGILAKFQPYANGLTDPSQAPGLGSAPVPSKIVAPIDGGSSFTASMPIDANTPYPAVVTLEPGQVLPTQTPIVPGDTAIPMVPVDPDGSVAH